MTNQKSSEIPPLTEEERNDFISWAVAWCVHGGNHEHILTLFRQGYPLNEHPESRKLIEELLKRGPKRRNGRPKNDSPERITKENKVVLDYLKEMSKTRGESKTAYQHGAAKELNTSESNFRKRILPKAIKRMGIEGWFELNEKTSYSPLANLFPIVNPSKPKKP